MEMFEAAAEQFPDFWLVKQVSQSQSTLNQSRDKCYRISQSRYLISSYVPFTYYNLFLHNSFGSNQELYFVALSSVAL